MLSVLKTGREKRHIGKNFVAILPCRRQKATIVEKYPRKTYSWAEKNSYKKNWEKVFLCRPKISTEKASSGGVKTRLKNGYGI